MDYSDVVLLTSDLLFSKLGTSSSGLTEEESRRRFLKFGENKIKTRDITALDIFRRQLKSPFVFLLFFAGILSFALGEKIDALMILVFVLINTTLGFYHEYKSEQTAKLLKKFLSPKVSVLRGGKKMITEVSLLVPGDIVFLEPGDIIPADIRFVEDYNLVVDESVLTGESVQVEKTSRPLSKKAEDIFTASNIGFSGTTVVGGSGVGVVFATGQDTCYAKIVKLTSETRKESSFEREIAKFSRFTLWVVLATLLFVVVTSIAIKPDPSLVELILFSIALAVSVIPEALPVVITFSLSIGAYNLARKKVVVKRLTSVEDLGALEVLASDKTGTLTQNKLDIAEVFSDRRADTLFFSALASYFAGSTRNAQNNAFDIAFKKSLGRKQLEKLKGYKKIGEIPFDPVRRRVTALLVDSEKAVVISRGSPEEVLRISRNVEDRARYERWMRDQGKLGRRCLAVAYREFKKEDLGVFDNELGEDMEKDLDLLGLVSFSDPIKPSAPVAIQKARQLGVNVKIVTGDSPEVAGTVAKEIGLIEDSSKVLTGADLSKMSLKEMRQAVDEFSVFARITPEQKHKIIELIKEKHYVGFLGEGINDAPALKAANVAVAVEGASDIAREASDIVLLEKDLGVIIDGVEEGRRVFVNTSKYITATMASNFGNFFAIALITPFIQFLPLLPLQILLINLLSDFPMIGVATDNVDIDAVGKPKRYNLKSFVILAFSFGLVSTVFDFATFKYFSAGGEKYLQTYWFMESILTELMVVFVIRSAKPIFKAGAPSRAIVLLSVIAAVLTILSPFLSFGQAFFGFIRPSFDGVAAVALIVFAYLVASELLKLTVGKNFY
jgi:Mg2+-importing ATPase